MVCAGASRPSHKKNIERKYGGKKMKNTRVVRQVGGSMNDEYRYSVERARGGSYNAST
jgi:hypothetical protein